MICFRLGASNADINAFRYSVKLLHCNFDLRAHSIVGFGHHSMIASPPSHISGDALFL